MSKIHHSAICTRDVDASLRFWRDGLGFDVIMDMPFAGDWPTLFNAPTTHLRSVFLGDPGDLGAGIVELVAFGDADGAPVGAAAGETDPTNTPATGGLAPTPSPGFFLLSLSADLDAVLPRLAELGVGGVPRIVEAAPGVRLAVVVDPDGVVVELMDQAAQANIGTIADAGAGESADRGADVGAGDR